MELLGSEILLECLLEHNVNTVFGYPGSAVLSIYDALYKYRDKIKHYLSSHEQHSAHAADGYARATGRVGVCIATSGPGATNLVTGIATAYMDSVPLVAITGNVAKNQLGRDSFQEVDIHGITMPITKHNFIVKDISDLAETVRRAFYIAAEGRPGPVLIDITKDVTTAKYQYTKKEPYKITEKSISSSKSLEEIAKIIDSSEKLLIYGGGGIISSNAADELYKFVTKTNSAVCLSAMGLGAFPSSHENFIGMLGMHGTKASNLALSTCDVLIAVGARFSERVVPNPLKFASNAKIIHIDIDPAEINKNVRADYSVVGDAKQVLNRLLALVQKKENKSLLLTAGSYEKENSPAYQKSKNLLQPQFILERINEAAKLQNTIIVTEVGQHQMWACHYIGYEKPRSFITSGGLGTMGYGLGASIGAQIGCPDARVFNIAGDGCFRMNNIELATAARYNIPIIVVIMNNHTLGMVRQWQSLFHDGRFYETELDRTVNFEKIAEAYNIKAYSIIKPESVDSILKEAMAHNGPVVINCEISSDEHVMSTDLPAMK